MPTVFEKLRPAREARKLTLEDISNATRIQPKILKALEEGNVSGIPTTYIKAFLKSYAKEVGLNAAEIAGEYVKQQTEQEAHVPVKREQRQPRTPMGFPKLNIKFSQNSLLAVVAGVIVLSFVVSLSLVNPGDDAGEVQEIPFQEVVKEQSKREAASLPPPDTARSTAGVELQEAPQLRVAQQPPPPTQLELRAMTFDSVWIRIVIDGKTRREYYVPARWSQQWKADDHFIVSVDNASAVSFILNNAPLGIIGPPGEPVTNHLIRRSDIPRQAQPENQ